MHSCIARDQKRLHYGMALLVCIVNVHACCGPTLLDERLSLRQLAVQLIALKDVVEQVPDNA